MPDQLPPTIVTIGNFDGVHRGHRALIDAARGLMADGKAASITAVVFDPHPSTVLRPGSGGPARLSSFAQRERWLGELGVARVVRLDARGPLPGAGDRTVLELTAQEFVAWARAELGAQWFVEGPDFQFGKQRAGSVATLSQLAAAWGGGARAIEPIDISLADGTTVPARSGTVRSLVEMGRVEDAAAVLGRPYELDGTVVRGDRQGREIGFPTANIQTDHLLPKDGVYAGVAVLPDGSIVAAATSVGMKPTFAGVHARTLETHLIGIGGAGRTLNGLAEYGWPVRLQLTHWLRGQVKFDGLPALIDAIKADCRQVTELTIGLTTTERAGKRS